MPVTIPPQVRRDYITPSAIEVLLHYYTCPGDLHPRHAAPAVVEARLALLRLGAIQPVTVRNRVVVVPMDIQEIHPDALRTYGYFAATKRGEAWVEALCRTTCPDLHDQPNLGDEGPYATVEDVSIARDLGVTIEELRWNRFLEDQP